MISILVPTLQRPHRLRSLLDSANNTLQNKKEVEFLFYVDNEDRSTDEGNIINQFNELQLKFFRRPSVKIAGQRYNYLAKESSGDILMYNADDMLFQSKKWDVIVNEVFNSYSDRILLLVPQFRNKHKQNLAISGFLSRRHVEIIGSLFTEYFTQWFDDLWLSRVYQSIGRFQQDLRIQMVHNHYSYNNSFYDKTYEKYKGNGEYSINNARVIFQNKSFEISSWANKLRKHIQ